MRSEGGAKPAGQLDWLPLRSYVAAGLLSRRRNNLVRFQEWGYPSEISPSLRSASDQRRAKTDSVAVLPAWQACGGAVKGFVLSL